MKIINNKITISELKQKIGAKMNYEHKNLAGGRWNELNLNEQMANIGSEVFRAISWKNKQNNEYSQKAFYRALELLSLSIDDSKNKFRLKELTRLYEVLVDYFFGDNNFASSEHLWQNYFYPFNFAARN